MDDAEPAALLKPSFVRWIGTGVALAVVAFASVALVLHWLRVDLDWYRNPLSAYLSGPYAAWLKAAYVLLSCAMVLLGLAYHCAVATAARSRVPALLFALAGLALIVTAFAKTPLRGHGSRLEGYVHQVAAAITFLSVTSAMLIQSWRLRRDAAWRRHFVAAFSLAVACFVGMWTYFLWRDAPRGLSQKLLIAGILTWLELAAWWLRAHAMQRGQGH